MPSITCPVCGRTSHHPEDVRTGYCGACHAFTSVDAVTGHVACPNDAVALMIPVEGKPHLTSWRCLVPDCPGDAIATQRGYREPVTAYDYASTHLVAMHVEDWEIEGGRTKHVIVVDGWHITPTRPATR